jgi:hypothetical protein
MKYLFFTYGFLISLFGSYAQTDNFKWDWVKHASANGLNYGLKTNTDIGGNVYVAGQYENNLVIENDTLHAGTAYFNNFLTKYNAHGEKIWTKDLIVHKEVHTTAIEIDANENVYLTGYYKDSLFIDNQNLPGSSNDYEGFVAKLNQDGHLVWLIKLGGTGEDKIIGAKLNQYGNLIIGGSFLGISRNYGGKSLTSLEPYSQIFVLSITPQGTIDWAKNSKRGQSEVTDIVLDNSSNIYLSGSYNSGISFNGINYITNGPVGTYDFFLLKFNAKGDFLWCKEGGTGSGDGLTNIATDSYGNCFGTGYFGIGNAYSMSFDSTHSIAKTNAYYYSFFLVKYDRDGTVQWAFKYDSQVGNVSQLHVLKTDNIGNCYLSGKFDGIWFGGDQQDTIAYSGASSNYSDICIQQFKSNGSRGWNIFAGNKNYGTYEDVIDFSISQQGAIYITGGHGGYDSLRIGDIVVPNKDVQDFYIAKLTSPEKIILYSDSAISVCPGKQLSVFFSLTDSVFETNNISTLQLSDEHGSFASPVSLATIKGNHSDTFAFTLPLALKAGTHYLYRVVSTLPAYTSYPSVSPLTIYNLPAKPSIVKTDSLLTCTLVASAYQWYFNDSAIAASDQQTYIATETGVYRVEVINSNGCSNLSNSIQFTKPTPVGLHENNATEIIAMYPNPVNNLLQIAGPADLIVRCYDVYGREVDIPQTGTNLFNFTRLKIGIYILVIESKEQGVSVVKKIAKE